MMVGMAAAVFTYRPIYQSFLDQTDVKAWTASVSEQSTPEIKMEAIKKTNDSLRITSIKMQLSDGAAYTQVQTDTLRESGLVVGKTTIKDKHIPKSMYWNFVFLVFIQILYVTMVYGPIAAFLVELFPTKIRYTSMSLPYHIGNGVFGGLVPFIGLLLATTYPSDPLVGLWYPIGVASLCLIIGVLYLNNTIDENVND